MNRQEFEHEGWALIIEPPQEDGDTDLAVIIRTPKNAHEFADYDCHPIRTLTPDATAEEAMEHVFKLMVDFIVGRNAEIVTEMECTLDDMLRYRA
jgi:hypothetical protein